MSFAFIPVPSENPLFNEKTVNEKWNKFMDKLCTDIITSLDLKSSDISKTEISDIITENLNKHYFIQSTPTSKLTPTKDTPIKDTKSKQSSEDEEEVEEKVSIPTPTKTKAKTVVKKVSKKQPEPEPESNNSDEESEKEEEVLKPKKELKKSSKEDVKLKEESTKIEKVDKDRCIEILKNNSQCKGKAVLGSKLCSRHNKSK
jgi:hypothetical protein